jgi:L-alanine-DL-glutamate epimerase-like enolase superfamily enzyme
VSGTGGRIASIESFTDEWVGFVRVRTDDGGEGWGQVSPYNADITAEVLHRQVAPHVLGADAADTAALGTRVLEAEHKYPGSYVCRALAGVDTALWDLRGRREGVPVCTLAGGAPRALDAYASSMRRDIAPAAEAERLARLRAEHGYRAFKFRVGMECGHDRDEWPGRTEEIVPAIRRALGDDARLLVDANSCYTPARAIEVGRLLEQWGVEHFEEPCPYWELEWTAEVAAALDLAVAGGEQDCFLWQWRRMVALRAVDVVQPDVCYVGGFTRALAVARMAADAGLACVPHSANLSLVTPFAQHLLCAIPNAGPYLELSIEGPDYYPWQYDLYDPPIAIRDGRLAAPEGPGWGVEVNPRWLAAAARRETRAI